MIERVGMKEGGRGGGREGGRREGEREGERGHRKSGNEGLYCGTNQLVDTQDNHGVHPPTLYSLVSTSPSESSSWCCRQYLST